MAVWSYLSRGRNNRVDEVEIPHDIVSSKHFRQVALLQQKLDFDEDARTNHSREHNVY